MTRDGPVPPAIAAGIEHFNARRYFEAHEAWEDHWGLGPPGERALVLGLIKAAVALHHLENGNLVGFGWQMEKALPLLRANADVWPWMRAAALADELDSIATQVRFHGAAPADRPAVALPR